MKKFCLILKIDYDQAQLKIIEEILHQNELHLLGLKQFAYIQEELNIENHAKLIEDLKNATEKE